tara:strand:- start:3463 stop:4392 length:930 start_codon:yes stop_codon:yes gene_type:complete
MKQNVILLMGPTASGKTDLAISLFKKISSDIISVDSAMVYRGMNIGTAKPDVSCLNEVPHQLIDIRDPENSYSAGEFVRDAFAAITASTAKGNIPIFVGGTMMYFRALTKGIAKLPLKNDETRKIIDIDAGVRGWPSLHDDLKLCDPEAAARINPNDSQRIQRALEVFYISGKSITDWHKEIDCDTNNINFIKIALVIEPRALLHQLIEVRLDQMISKGLEEELKILRNRPLLKKTSSSMRAVGYRQFWTYLDGDCSWQEARDRSLFATRQLAKRQLTWLRSESDVFFINPLEASIIDTISTHITNSLE